MSAVNARCGMRARSPAVGSEVGCHVQAMLTGERCPRPLGCFRRPDISKKPAVCGAAFPL